MATLRSGSATWPTASPAASMAGVRREAGLNTPPQRFVVFAAPSSPAMLSSDLDSEPEPAGGEAGRLQPSPIDKAKAGAMSDASARFRAPARLIDLTWNIASPQLMPPRGSPQYSLPGRS